MSANPRVVAGKFGALMAMKAPRRNAAASRSRTGKYRNIKTQVDGYTFDSKKEAHRYGQLKILLAAGRIRNLELQPKYDLAVGGRKICGYRADFRYEEMLHSHHWVSVVEDCKGMRTPVYLLKRKLMAILLNIEIRET